MENKNSSLIAVRAVTAFVVLTTDDTKWKTLIEEAVIFAANLANDIRESFYTVQSLRVITNPFGEYLDTSTAESALAGMDIIKTILNTLENEQAELLQGSRIRFSIGAADATNLSLVPALIRSGGDLANCCINVPVDDNNVVDSNLVYESAKICTELGSTTERGEGNFNFTVCVLFLKSNIIIISNTTVYINIYITNKQRLISMVHFYVHIFPLVLIQKNKVNVLLLGLNIQIY